MDLKFSLNLVFRMVIIAYNDHAASQKIAKAFQLNYNAKLLTLACDFRFQGASYDPARKVFFGHPICISYF